VSEDLLRIASDLLYREAAFIDQQRWAEWLDLFVEDAEYWIPCWDDDGALTGDPTAEVSLIYYKTRQGLEDRVWRITSGLSPALAGMPRTCHQITNVRLGNSDGESLEVASNWITHSFHHGETTAFYGFYDHRLRRVGDRWRISRKKITILNDVIPTLLDIFSV
jgi:3-phenylpropionate/cinnamic acid dioxygenase small subunit